MRPRVKPTSSRICVMRSHPACCTAGVMNFEQMSRSLRSFLFMLGKERWARVYGPCGTYHSNHGTTPAANSVGESRRQRSTVIATGFGVGRATPYPHGQGGTHMEIA